MRILYIFIVILFFSCTDEFTDYKYPFDKDKPIVYGAINQDGDISIEIYKTQPIYSQDSFKVEKNLDVFIVDGQQVAHKIPYNNGIYYSNMPNIKYPVTLKFEYKNKEYSSPSIQQVLPFRLENFVYDTIYTQEKILISYKYDIVNPNDEEVYLTHGKINKEKKNIIEYEFYQTQNPLSTETKKSRYKHINSYKRNGHPKITFSSVSKDVFLHIKQGYKNEPELGNLASQNNSSPTNIEGAYGFFGSFYTQSITK